MCVFDLSLITFWFLQEVLLQKQSAADKFGLTLCYRPSDVQHNLTEVYVSEVR